MIMPTKTITISSAELFRLNMRRRISDLGISDAEVARRVGMSPPNIWQYLNGDRRPGLDVLDRFAEAVDLPTHQLIMPIDD